MSTPATVESTPQAYGERQPIVAPVSSEGVMENLSRVATEDVAVARQRLKIGYDDALSQLEMQYQMEKARLTAQYADLDGRLKCVEETIATYRDSAVKAMDSFLGECKSASIVAVEIVPPPSPRQIEDHVSSQEPPPKFLQQRPNPTVTPIRRGSIIPVAIFFVVVALTAIGFGIGMRI